MLSLPSRDYDEEGGTNEGPDQKRGLRGMMLKVDSKWGVGCSNSAPGTGWRSLPRSGWHIL